jgi:hypothetical protein
MFLLIPFGTTSALDVRALGNVLFVLFYIFDLEGIRGCQQKTSLFFSCILDHSVSSTPK